MRNVAYYHVYLDDNYVWAQIFMEQMRVLEKSNLMKNLDVLKITAITQFDHRLEVFKNFCTLYPVNIELQCIRNIHDNDEHMKQSIMRIFDKNVPIIGERPCFKRIWNDSREEDFNILYFHMKGITSTLINLMVPDFKASKYKNRYDWRQFLNWGVISKWEECLKNLEHNHIAGVDYQEIPAKHFRGNFWWTTSSHIRHLPDPENMEWWEDIKRETNDQWLNNICDRFADEYWVCRREDLKAFNLSPNYGHYISNDT